MVSIITPCYNASTFIEETIKSVQSQTYDNWEILIVDDCSTDNSADIIKKYAEKDGRIKYLKTETPSGSPTTPRNIAIQAAIGRYIAFLDSDDLWLPNKLETQLKCFEANDKVGVVFSYYEKIDEEGNRDNRFILSPDNVTYNKLLHGNVIGNLTGIYDTLKVGKVFMKHVGHEDYVMWLQILKKGYIAKNTNTVEALYRVRKNSVSANKLKVLKWTWNIYRNEEKLGLWGSVYYFMNYAFKAVVKTLK